MSGRQEQDLQREKWIEEKLDGQPEIFRDYMLSIKNLTSSSRKAYLGYLIQFSEFMESQNVKIAKAKPLHINRYIDHISQDTGPSIVNTKISAIINFYEFLIENGFVKTNPCSTKMMLKKNKNDKVIFMTDDEVEHMKFNALGSKFPTRDICIITLGCATGLRVSAIRNIDIEDIDFDNKIINVVEKGNNEREVYIGDNTIRVIKTWMKERERLYGNNTGPLFMSQKKNRMAVRTIEEMIHNAADGIDKHITPHKMRSTCAMNLYEKTGDIYLTAQQLGHENIQNTMIYAKATEGKRREAAELLD